MEPLLALLAEAQLLAISDRQAFSATITKPLHQAAELIQCAGILDALHHAWGHHSLLPSLSP
jgi:hypothetical protein